MLPMPPVKGGAVQNLIQLYIDSNEITKNDNIYVFSLFNKEAVAEADKFSYTEFYYIKNSDFLEKLHEKGLKYISALAFRIRTGLYIKRIIQKIKSMPDLESLDIIVVENWPKLILPLRRIFSGKHLCIHLHNDYLNKKTKKGTKISSASDKIICISDYICGLVREVAEPRKIVRVYNGVKLTPSDSGMVNHLKSQYNIKEDDFVVIFSGRLVQNKGAHILLQAYDYINKKEKIKFIFLGSRLYGQSSNDVYINGLKKKAEMHPDNIIFTGYIDYKEISNYYALGNVGCLPALWDEPLSLTVIEYLMSGLPVIATRSGGIPELLDNSCSFMLERDLDLPQNIAKKIEYLQQNPSIRNEMSDAAIKRGAYFNSDTYVSELRNTFNACIQEKVDER